MSTRKKKRKIITLVSQSNTFILADWPVTFSKLYKIINPNRKTMQCNFLDLLALRVKVVLE